MRHGAHFVSAFTAGLVAAMVAMPAGTATAQSATMEGPVVSWDWALIGTARSGTRVFDETAKLVSDATGGKFTIKIHYGETLAPPREILDGINIGAFQGGWVVPSFYPGKLPGVGGLDLPVLPVNNIRALAQVQEAYVALPEIERDFTRWNAKSIAVVTVPPYEFAGKGRPLQTLADFKGMRLRALGGLADVIRLFGGVPTSFPSPENYSNIERGVVDGVGLAYYAIASSRIHEIADWYTKGFAFPSPSSMVGIGSKAFEALPPQYQTLLIAVGPKAARVQIDGLDEIEAKSEAEFKAKGVKTIVIAPEVRQELLERAAQPVFDKWVQEITAKGYPGQKLIDFLISQSRKASS